jgi:hypothetical protein
MERHFELASGYLGNGLTVWNRKEEENRDYKTLAHISEDGKITYYDKTLPEEIKEKIERLQQIYFYKETDRGRGQIETRLTNLLVKIGLDHPDNFGEIVSFIVEDLQPDKRLEDCTDKEIVNSFKKFIER